MSSLAGEVDRRRCHRVPRVSCGCRGWGKLGKSPCHPSQAHSVTAASPAVSQDEITSLIVGKYSCQGASTGVLL